MYDSLHEISRLVKFIDNIELWLPKAGAFCLLGYRITVGGNLWMLIPVGGNLCMLVMFTQQCESA